MQHKSNLVFYLIGLLLLIVMIGFYFWPKEIPQEIPPAITIPERHLQEETLTSSKKVILTAPTPTASYREEGKETAMDSQVKPSTNPFTLNPAIENSMEKLVDLPELLEVDFPDQESTFIVKDEGTTLKFQASLLTERSIPVNLLIYDHQASNYLEFKPLMVRKNLRPSDQKPYTISFDEKLDLPPGTYYLLIESAEEQEILGIERIQIRESQ